MSAPITQAHYDLRRQVLFSAPDDGAQLIADSEAAAVAQWSGGLDQSLPDLYEAAKSERDQLRAEITRLDAEKPWLKEANATNADLRAEVERLTIAGLLDVHAICDQRDAANARAERADAELAVERARLRDLWCEMALEYRDERISYVSVQITRSVWDELDAAMKEGK